VCIAFWMGYTYWQSQGPIIVISFKDAAGIEAGKTKLKRRSVVIGEVIDVALSKKEEGVLVSVQIDKEEASTLSSDSKFWLVSPRVGLSGVTGLETLLSGAYIEFALGTGKAGAALTFTGLDTPPPTAVGTPGLHVTLVGKEFALAVGDPVLYQGRRVGTIEYVHFNIKERVTYYNAFVSAPYNKVITDNTRFWLSSGLNVDLSLDGVQVNVGTLETILSGGVSFGVPKDEAPGSVIDGRREFVIHRRKSDTLEKNYAYASQYVVLLSGTIKGINVNAPVEFRGLPIGKVIRADVARIDGGNLLDANTTIPVIIQIEPARLGFEDSLEGLEAFEAEMLEQLAEGLSASVVSGNLITGQKYIELQHLGTKSVNIQRFSNLVVLPSVEDQFDRMLENVASILESVDAVPLKDIGNNVNRVLEEATEILENLSVVSEDLGRSVGDPAVTGLVSNLNSTLAQIDQLAGSFSAGSTTHNELRENLQALHVLLKDLSPLLKTLNRQPNSLIFGSTFDPDEEPKGKSE
jgi:paraquat-inducible protein B